MKNRKILQCEDFSTALLKIQLWNKKYMTAVFLILMMKIRIYNLYQQLKIKMIKMTNYEILNILSIKWTQIRYKPLMIKIEKLIKKNQDNIKFLDHATRCLEFAKNN